MDATLAPFIARLHCFHRNYRLRAGVRPLEDRVATLDQSDGAVAVSGSHHQQLDDRLLHDDGLVNVTYDDTNEALSETGFTGLQRTGHAIGGGSGFLYARNPDTRIDAALALAEARPSLAVTRWCAPPLWSRLT